MPCPNVVQILNDCEHVDEHTSLDEAKQLRKRIYHAFYYHNRGWLELTTPVCNRLRAHLLHIKRHEHLIEIVSRSHFCRSWLASDPEDYWEAVGIT